MSAYLQYDTDLSMPLLSRPGGACEDHPFVRRCRECTQKRLKEEFKLKICNMDKIINVDKERHISPSK